MPVLGAVQVNSIKNRPSAGAVASGLCYKVVNDTAAAITLTGDDSFTVRKMSTLTAMAYTLPNLNSVEPGYTVKFVVNGNFSADHTITTSASQVIYGGVREAEIDTGDDHPWSTANTIITFVNTLDSLGDWVRLTSLGDKWHLEGAVQSDGAITLTGP